MRTRLVSPTVKLVLLALADDMAIDGSVSTPRSALASRLGMAPRRVTEYVAAAVDARLLERT